VLPAGAVPPAAGGGLVADGATEVLRPAAGSGQSTAASARLPLDPERRRAVVIIAGIAAALLVIVVVLNLARSGAPASDTGEGAGTSATPTAEAVAEEPVVEEPVEPVYPAVAGELGQALIALQQLVAYDQLEEAAATALQQQVLAVTTSAAAGDLEAAKDGVESLKRAADEARTAGTISEDQSRGLREAVDAVKRLIDDARHDDDGPGKGPKDD
jgi:hypothetical protein